MKTAVIYARFSCSKQREASIDDQLRVCFDWCSREGYTVVNTYCDHAISGRTDERPAFQAMIEHAGESQICLVYMMDRFSRDPYDAPLYKKKLHDKDVRVVSATESIPDSPEAILIEKLYEGLAAVESAHIAERTKRGMKGNALKCMHNGVPVFGYSFGENGQYVINEDEARVVSECFARRIEGEPVDSIARDLARRGYTTSNGNPANYTFVYNMLKNEKYKGVYLWGDVRTEDGMPRIISDEIFAEAQTVRSKKKRHEEMWDEYMLSGRAICEGCGRNMVGVSGRGHGNVKYTYYRCGKKCGVKAIRADELESQIANAIRSMLEDRDKAFEIAKIVEQFVNGNDNTQAIANARKRHEEAQSAIRNLLRAVAQGLDFEDVREDLSRYKEISAAALTEQIVYECEPYFDVNDFCDFLQFGATLDDKHLLDAMVSQVMVGDDHITVTLNYDIKKSEPARLTIERVRTDLVWLPKHQTMRTIDVAVDKIDKSIILRFPRVPKTHQFKAS